MNLDAYVKVRTFVWLFVAAAIIAVGTVVALWRQQVNFNDHADINTRSCKLNVEVRVLIADGFGSVANNPLIDAETRAELMRLTRRAEELRDETAKTCRAT